MDAGQVPPIGGSHPLEPTGPKRTVKRASVQPTGPKLATKRASAPNGSYTLEIETTPGSNKSKAVPGIVARTKEEGIEKGMDLGNENPRHTIYVIAPSGFCVSAFEMEPER